MHRRKTVPASGIKEAWPAISLSRDDVHVYRLRRVDAVKAWALIVLELQKLNESALFAGRRNYLKAPTRIMNHQSGGSGLQQVDTCPDQRVEEVDDVVIVNEGVCQVNEAFGQHGVALRIRSRPSGSGHSSSIESRRRRATTSDRTP